MRHAFVSHPTRHRVAAPARAWQLLLIAALVGWGLSDAPVQAQPSPVTTPTENACYDAVQGKVARNRAGSTGWNDGNVRRLCADTTNPSATIACFEGQIAEHDDWNRAINACAGVSPAQPLDCTPEDFGSPADYLGDVCYSDSYGRGAGRIPTECPSGTENQAGLCYPQCRAGYRGVVTMCVPDCPPGFRDDGLYCAKPEPYGRGAGFPWQFGDALNDDGMRQRCEQAHGGGNCEKWGAVYYPKCRTNFHAAGCCVCSPNCPAGMNDIGVSCQKVTYDRGVGRIPGCASGEVSDAGLCYPRCRDGYVGGGPVCWASAEACPAKFPFKCGALCARDETLCARATTRMAIDPLKAVISTAGLVLSYGATAPITPIVENIQLESERALRVEELKQQFLARASTLNCTLSDGAAQGLAEDVWWAEMQGTPGNEPLKNISRVDPTALTSAANAFVKPECRNIR